MVSRREGRPDPASVEDRAVETAVLDAVDLVVDYGLSKYHNDLGRSSTIIDFTNFSVIRVGVMFDQLQNAFQTRFNVKLTIPEKT